MDKKNLHKSKITLHVELDETKTPEIMGWEAPDSGVEGMKTCDGAFLTFWDSKTTSSYRIDLWTKKMRVDDMQRFIYENLMSMADTLERATSDKESAKELRTFSNDLIKKIRERN
jgi:gliding motility-associated protein GldC